MACYMLKLSNELHVQIFESLNDLDDARDLGRSCRHFSQLHVTHKRKIAQSIIVSRKLMEFVYEYIATHSDCRGQRINRAADLGV